MLVIISISYSYAQQQSLKFRHLNTEDGLSHPSVTGVLKDRFGFMWFGTRDGLNRYDSYNFTQFRYDSRDSTTISNNTINCLLEDSQGIIWIGTEGGLNSYHHAKNKFRRYLNTTDNTSSLPENSVLAICEADENSIWVGTRSGLSLLHQNLGVLRSYTFTDEGHTGSGSHVNHILKDADGILWIATEGAGLVRLNPATEEINYYRHHPNDPSTIGSDIINNIFEDRQGKLWIGSWGYGMSSFDKKTEKFVRYMGNADNPLGLPSNNIFAITQDQQGLLWLGTRNGLCSYDPLNDAYEVYQPIAGNPYSLADQVAFSMYYDETHQILWVGTWGDGINLLDRYGRQTTHFQNNPEDANSLNNDDIFAVFEDDQGIVWIGTEGGGLNRYDPETGNFKAYLHDPQDPTSISHNEVMCIHQDKRGQYWIGTFGGGLNKFDPSSETFQTYQGRPDRPFKSINVISIYEDSKGLLWLTTPQDGVVSIDTRIDYYTYYGSEERTDQVVFNDVMDILEDPEGNMWFGSRNSGITVLSPDKHRFSNFVHDPNDPQSLGSNGIYAFLLDSNDNLWIGTRGSGLNSLKLPPAEDPVFNSITTADGIVNDWILGIEEDRHGNIWASCYGLSRISAQSQLVTSYSFTESNQGAFHQGRRSGAILPGF